MTFYAARHSASKPFALNNAPTGEWRPCHILEHGSLASADDCWQDIDLIQNKGCSKLPVVSYILHLRHCRPSGARRPFLAHIPPSNIIHLRHKLCSQCQGPRRLPIIIYRKPKTFIFLKTCNEVTNHKVFGGKQRVVWQDVCLSTFPEWRWRSSWQSCDSQHVRA